VLFNVTRDGKHLRRAGRDAAEKQAAKAAREAAAKLFGEQAAQAELARLHEQAKHQSKANRRKANRAAAGVAVGKTQRNNRPRIKSHWTTEVWKGSALLQY